MRVTSRWMRNAAAGWMGLIGLMGLSLAHAGTEVTDTVAQLSRAFGIPAVVAAPDDPGFSVGRGRIWLMRQGLNPDALDTHSQAWHLFHDPDYRLPGSLSIRFFAGAGKRCFVYLETTHPERHDAYDWATTYGGVDRFQLRVDARDAALLAADHEMGHCGMYAQDMEADTPAPNRDGVALGGMYTSLYQESVADVFSVLRHIQRTGDRRVPAILRFARDMGPALLRGAVQHDTGMAIQAALQERRATGQILAGRSPQELLYMARDIVRSNWPRIVAVSRAKIQDPQYLERDRESAAIALGRLIQ